MNKNITTEEKEIMKKIAIKTIEKIKKELKINDIKVKDVSMLPGKAHKKTFMEMDKESFIKHYMILDTEKLLSIPVFAIKKNKKSKPIFRGCTVSFRRNIGLLEVEKTNNKIKGILYVWNVRREIYC